MSFCERICHLHCNVQHFTRLKRPTSKMACESFTFNVLHHDEAAPAFFTDFVNRADIWVIQLGGGLGLADQTPPGLLIAG